MLFECGSPFCPCRAYNFAKTHTKAIYTCCIVHNLTAVPGFQSHDTLGRYFLLVEDLSAMATTVSTTHPAFKEFQDTIDALPVDRKQHQKTKASKFVSMALDAVHKHFSRWCNETLLPAAFTVGDAISQCCCPSSFEEATARSH
jgi:hypothetical protein